MFGIVPLVGLLRERSEALVKDESAEGSETGHDVNAEGTESFKQGIGLTATSVSIQDRKGTRLWKNRMLHLFLECQRGSRLHYVRVSSYRAFTKLKVGVRGEFQG